MGKVSYNFENEVAVITGAATGIGRETAIQFAKAGAAVAICDFNEEAGTETAELCRKEGVQAGFYKLDVTSKRAEIDKVRDQIITDFGKVDILFSNAAAGPVSWGKPMEDIDENDWERVFAVNYHGTVKVCSSFSVPLKAQKSGKVIITSSISQADPDNVVPVYGSTKNAQVFYTRSLARELGPFNVNVNAVSPGFVYTPIYSTGAAEKLQKQFQAKMPQIMECKTGEEVIDMVSSVLSVLKRPQTSEDIANSVLFLSSDQASEITGQNLNVDSGVVLHN